MQKPSEDPLHPHMQERALEQTLPSAQFAAIASSDRSTEAGPPIGATPDLARPERKIAPAEESSSIIDKFGNSDDLPRELQTVETPATSRFSVIEQIGTGATSRVFAVHDNGLGRTVAIKFLKGQGTLQEEARQQFLHEAHVTANLEHPNIMPIHDIGLTDDQRLYFTMKHIRGVTVGDAIRAAKEGKVVPEEFKTVEGCLRIVLKVCDGLTLAHDHGYVHQDIKPDNIMLGSYGEVLLLDWGCALSSSKTLENDPDTMYGTPAYMAPEQARRERADARSDIYCLGATLYHMLFLCHPSRNPDPEEFWEMKRRGELSSPPPSAPPVPYPLMTIMEKALAANPDQRYQTAREFQKNLLEYMDHAESLAITSTAVGHLDTAVKNRDLAAISRIGLQLDQALAMWKENELARKALGRTNEAYVQTALALGDYHTVVSFCSDKPALKEYAARARKALVANARQQHRSRMQRGVLVGLVFAVVGLLAYFGIDYYRQFGRWHKIYHHDFVHNPAVDTSMLFDDFNFDDFSLTDNDVPYEPVFSQTGIRLSQGDNLWITSVREQGDIRVAVQVLWPEIVDGLEISINAENKTNGDWVACPPGYSCQFGGYSGTTSYISRNPTVQPPTVANGVPHAFVPQKLYTLVFQRVDDLLSLYVDNRVILEQPEPLPVQANADGHVQVRSWGDAVIKSITVWRLDLPEKSSPVIAGNALLQRGHAGEALNEYLRIAKSHGRSRTGKQAVLKASLLAATMPEIPDSLRTEIQSLAADLLPARGLYLQTQAAESQRLWRSGKTGQAIALAEHTLDKNPDSRVVMSLLGAGKHVLSPELADRLLGLVARTKRLARLDLGSMGIKNLDPLRGTKLDNLLLDYNKIEDLSPLSNMPLSHLSVTHNNISSLEPLRGMPLVRLNVGFNTVTSLEPLRGMALTYLAVNDNELENLDAVRGMPLEYFKCDYNSVESLEPLREASRLSELHMAYNTISDLSPIKNLPIKKLFCMKNKIVSLEPLRSMPLDVIICMGNPISDLSPLSQLPLKTLDFSRCPVKTLAPLAHLALSEVIMIGTEVTDLGPLEQMVSLRGLDCSMSRVTSLNPLRKLHLVSLKASGLKVTSLEPLRGQPLAELELIDCPIRSLLPLKLSPLHSLSCQNCQITTLAPFEKKPPEKFAFYSPRLSIQYVQKTIAAWDSAGYQRAAKISDVEQAVLTSDVNRLLARTDTLDGHRYAWVQLFVPFGFADSCARAFGGHLVTLETDEEDAFATSLAENNQGFWIGIDPATNRWVTGSPITQNRFQSRFHEAGPGPWYKLGKHNTIGWHRHEEPNDQMRFIIEWD